MTKVLAFISAATLLVLLCPRGIVKADRADDAPNMPKWTKVEIPLKVYYHERSGYVSAEGFWQSTSPSSEKQLVSPIAVHVTCERAEKSCRELEASVFMGVLKPDLLEYDVTSWNDEGIVADESDDKGECGIGHRLSVDFKSNSVTVTDYPQRITKDKDCQPFQDANSYALRGGDLVLFPPPKWDPLEKSAGKN